MGAPGRAVRVGAAVVALAAVVVGAPSSPAWAGGPGEWTQLSQNPSGNGFPRTVNYDQPTAARFGSDVQVVWRAERDGGVSSYYSAQVDSRGRTSTRARELSAVSGWAGLIESPRLVAYGSQRMLVFSGQRDLDADNPYSKGAAYYALGTSATSWSMGAGSLSHTTDARSAYGSDAVIDDGLPVWAGNPATTTGLTWHEGVSADIPAPAGSDKVVELRGCCSSDAALARDDSGGSVFGAFYSSSGQAAEQGVWVGQILPTRGSFIRAPGSFTIRNGIVSSLSPDQRVAMSSRGAGGVYLAYRTGYPSPATWITLWRVGSPSGVSVPGSAGARSVSLAGGRDGRLWVAWTNDRGTRLRVVATDSTATRFGPVRTIRPPVGYGQLWRTTVVARAGRADVIVTAQNANGAVNVFHRQVRAA